MMVFRGCEKCQGDLFVERNLSDVDVVCLQCGYRRTVTTARYQVTQPRQLQPAR